MNSSLFAGLLCVLISICAGQYDQEEYSAALGADCQQKVDEAMKDYQPKAQDKWNSSEIREETNFGNKRSECCMIWDEQDLYLKTVKAHCNETEIENGIKNTKEKINEKEKQECKDYHYYSTRCTFTEADFKNTTTQAVKDKLLENTKINEPGKQCQDYVHTNKDSCTDKVAKDSKIKPEELTSDKVDHKVHCCFVPKIGDCQLERAKTSSNCTQLDVNGLIFENEKDNKNRTEGVCKDFTNLNEQCKTNNSLNIQTNALLIFAVISIFAFLFK